MSSEARILPQQLIQEVEMYVESELHDAAKYTNRQPLDDSGVWSLHALVARIYAAGWQDGERAEAERGRGSRRRERDSLAAALVSGVGSDTEIYVHQEKQ